MTRFMMSIDDALDLVLYAFENAQPGDIFVQKAKAATILTIANALKQIYKANNPVKIIGTRHGEKLYETLLTREEMARAEDLGRYYRVPADTRDLNYELFFTEGEERVSLEQDYNSHSAERLNIEGMVGLLMSLDIVRSEIKGQIE